MWRRVQHLDRRLMKRSFGTRSPALDRTLIAITRAANYSRLWLVVAGALAVFGGRARAEGGRARPHCHRDRGGGGKRSGKAARAPTSALLAVAPGAHPYAAVNVIPLRPQRRGGRVRHRRERRTADADACPGSACWRRCLLTRAYRRSLPERRRGWRGDRDRLRSAGRAFALA